MMQTLIADGKSEIDHGGLALFYEKLNSISLKKDWIIKITTLIINSIKCFRYSVQKINQRVLYNW